MIWAKHLIESDYIHILILSASPVRMINLKNLEHDLAIEIWCFVPTLSNMQAAELHTLKQSVDPHPVMDIDQDPLI